ncbi:MAG TPA: hypothetical protein PLD20_20825 [Blastocatellia bacterium]|nr:hypothetical protein [Blastocatellia bacterium]HMZ20393.1 hypothetical protein [Blastocatellia bacterium]HNG31862.1 hypothetical protein [Blastocatellia bacterium]
MLKILSGKASSQKNRLREPATPIVIALRVSRAAAAIDVSENYLRKAIAEGRLKVTTKREQGAGRHIQLILVDELRRFAAEDEGVGEE